MPPKAMIDKAASNNPGPHPSPTNVGELISSMFDNDEYILIEDDPDVEVIEDNHYVMLSELTEKDFKAQCIAEIDEAEQLGGMLTRDSRTLNSLQRQFHGHWHRDIEREWEKEKAKRAKAAHKARLIELGITDTPLPTLPRLQASQRMLGMLDAANPASAKLIVPCQGKREKAVEATKNFVKATADMLTQPKAVGSAAQSGAVVREDGDEDDFVDVQFEKYKDFSGWKPTV